MSTEELLQQIADSLMRDDPELSAADARYTALAGLTARQQTTNKVDEFARFYELMDGRPYGHAD